jgi:hypothetical protein
MMGFFEADSKLSGYRKCWEFLQWFSNCWLLTKNLDSMELVIFSRIETYWIVGLRTQVLRKMLGLEGVQILRGVRKLHDEELHNLFSHSSAKMIK